MTQMRFELLNDQNSGITLRLTADNTPEVIETTIRDTANGSEVRTEVVNREGVRRLITDKIDRATPPLFLMTAVLSSLYEAFATNAQALLNLARYERLQREGLPITLQTMCMDGHHTGPEYADVPFNGGIVGVPEHKNEAVEPEVGSDFLNALWGDDEDDDTDDNAVGAVA